MAALALLSLPAGASAASKAAVALLGDPAPGGGVFAGPGFTGWPAAAGAGWVAFRGEVSGGSTTETMVLAHMVAPITRAQVANIGQPAPGGGTFKQFLGPPAVNANGDVAFLAQVTRDQGDDDASSPQPAGVFLFHAGALAVVARTGQDTSAGTLDLLAVVDPDADQSQVPERTPGLNDAGDVAFVAGIQDNQQAPGAVFRVRFGGDPEPLIRIGEAFDGGAFVSLGPPALNSAGKVVFHGRVVTTDPAEPDGEINGIFAAGTGPAQELVHDGQHTTVNDLPLLEFEDAVSINDHGDVAFLAGPLYDGDTPPEESSPGIVVYSAGMLTVAAYPGVQVGSEGISSFKLGPSSGNALAPPSLTPEGNVVFFASLNGGSREAIVFWDGTNSVLRYTAGSNSDGTPAGGTYAGTESAPAVDATGGVAFLARIVGGVTAEAVIYQPVDGEGAPIVVGDAAPNAGFFAGRPFSTPLLNDAGDVVFRAFLARGSSSVGIFRSRGGVLESIVRAGDPTPLLDTAPFVDLVGQPSLNQAGAVAFAGQVQGKGLGIFVAESTGMRAVVVVGDPAPGDPGTVFKGLSPNPSINDAGTVAFRGTTLLRSATDRITREGIFLADAAGIRPLVWAHDPAPDGTPFFSLRDPSLTNVPSVAFRAGLGEDQATASGLFVADDHGVQAVAVEKDDLGGGVSLAHLSGDPIATPGGDLAFLAVRTRQVQPGLRKTLGPAILQRTAAGLGLVVAQDMPGPAGGTFRNLSSPALNALGHVAFRGSFLPFTGGTGGIFLATEMGLEPYLSSGEATPAGGRFASFGTRSALNANDDLAFSATVSRSAARSGIFVASRTELAVGKLSVRIHGGAHDRVRLGLSLRLGRLSNGLDPAHDTITVSLADGRGTLWAATVSPGQLKRRGAASVAIPRPGSALAQNLSALRYQGGRNGRARVSAVSALVDLTQGGSRELVAPVSVTLQVGDDGGTRTLPCHPGRHGLRCRAS